MSGVNEWYAKALSDLKSSKKLIKEDNDTLDTATYHTQHCAEKALKTYLVLRSQSVPLTHDLVKLLVICCKLDSTFQQLRDHAEALSPYAVYSRYPDDRFAVDREEALEAIEHAEKVLKFVKRKIDASLPGPQLKLFDE